MHSEYHLNLNQKVSLYFDSLIKQTYINEESAIISDSKLALAELKKQPMESYILDRIPIIENMLIMLLDSRWSLQDKDKNYLLAALKYFVLEDDIIPDNVPNIGMLDDCIVIDVAEKKLHKQLDNFSDFIQLEKIYSCNGNYNVQEWQKIKKIEVFSRLRHRRYQNRKHGTY